MTIGEALYLALVLVATVSFAAKLAWRPGETASEGSSA
jgi:hypothetical protein